MLTFGQALVELAAMGDVEWAEGVKKVFEEEGIAKGSAAVSYKGKMVDTPVYENALQILRTMEEIRAAEGNA